MYYVIWYISTRHKFRLASFVYKQAFYIYIFLFTTLQKGVSPRSCPWNIILLLIPCYVLKRLHRYACYYVQVSMFILVPGCRYSERTYFHFSGWDLLAHLLGYLHCPFDLYTIESTYFLYYVAYKWTSEIWYNIIIICLVTPWHHRNVITGND